MKVRVLQFENTDHDRSQDRRRFDLLYQGFMFGGNQQQSKGMDVLRREARILDTLDSISLVQNPGDGTPDDPARLLRTLAPGHHEVSFEEPDYALLCRYFNGAAWTTSVARQVVSISDWLAGIPQTDKE